ncbi:MAG: xanthine phosphoribosyltransferase [Micavibrio sp.]|nr:xanthine phosphoribosyltransferase [Micavibrio sp.]|tara:strand:- start:138 stop:593 length:456 start_codon:yes stop_codon:yes gene_type:complete
MSDYTQKQAISWDDIKRDSARLSEKLNSEFKLPKKILAVTRGGLMPASLVCRALGIKKIETIGLESYHGQHQGDVISVLKQAAPEFLEDTLILDDLVDTGKTYAYLREHTKNCLFATLYAKPLGAKYSDCFVEEFDQDTWIDFPWEMDFPE